MKIAWKLINFFKFKHRNFACLRIFRVCIRVLFQWKFRVSVNSRRSKRVRSRDNCIYIYIQLSLDLTRFDLREFTDTRNFHWNNTLMHTRKIRRHAKFLCLNLKKFINFHAIFMLSSVKSVREMCIIFIFYTPLSYNRERERERERNMHGFESVRYFVIYSLILFAF